MGADPGFMCTRWGPRDILPTSRERSSRNGKKLGHKIGGRGGAQRGHP